ncbi:hypothetical protein PRIPAC_94618 [Pristionchus pacificus]|uniref:Uncharacterized protein n=1 Tax=Pristionchus pacificus TaxID=54126 RepID=A0A2A6BAF7_PRIPA|nr:hypothetical protein PRIPAC_94618 [Pristionchus pacificus]|eukprot:PDM62862.1 hypothetical protein PRIPAC_50077 [Pristionchus pacificus]
MYVMQPQQHASGAGTGICVSLVQSALWSQFHAAQTEMIVTKTGRKLFPKLEISIQGLNPGRTYGVHMRLERADEKKYRYTCSKWSASNDDDDVCFPLPPPIESNEGFAQLGEFWTARAIEFSNFKITNNQDESGRGMILVQTLHKYVPVIYMYEMMPGASYANLEPTFVHKEVLHLAEFITVTAYQNEAIKTLKTAHNPFAKGCRGAAAKPALQQSPTDSLQQQRKRSYSPYIYVRMHYQYYVKREQNIE